MKKIIYICKYVSTPDDFRAPRNFSLMKSLVNLGYEVHLVTSTSNHLSTAPDFKGISMTKTIDGVQVTWLKTVGYTKTKSFRRIISWLDFELKVILMRRSAFVNADYIIASSLSILSVASGYLLSRRLSAKFIFEVRDIWPLTLVDEGGYRANHLLIRILGYIEKLAYKKADLIIGTMPNLQAHVRKVVPEITSDVLCVPMGYSEWHLNNQTEVSGDYVKQYFPAKKFLVTHLGSVGIANTLKTLTDCCRLLKEHSNIHFLVVGQGDSLKRLKEVTSDLRNITFAPSIPKEQVQSVLRKSDLLYFSTSNTEIWRYGQSLNKLVDYMLSARPIIGSFSGFASMINESKCGEFVEAENASALAKRILEYSQMPKEKINSLGLNGQSWLLENRHYDSLASDLDKALRNI